MCQRSYPEYYRLRESLAHHLLPRQRQPQKAFIHDYVKGKLFDLQTRAQQRKVFEGGARTARLWGHTGNIPGGYTQFMAASPDGKRSATVSINSQLTLTPTFGDPQAFKALRRAEGLAVCAALTGRDR